MYDKSQCCTDYPSLICSSVSTIFFKCCVRSNRDWYASIQHPNVRWWSFVGSLRWRSYGSLIFVTVLGCGSLLDGVDAVLIDALFLVGFCCAFPVFIGASDVLCNPPPPSIVCCLIMVFLLVFLCFNWRSLWFSMSVSSKVSQKVSYVSSHRHPDCFSLMFSMRVISSFVSNLRTIGLLESSRTENRALQGKPYTGKLIQFVEVWDKPSPN